MSGCEEVREILVSIARNEKVSGPDERFVREHVEACPPCRRLMANERMLSAGLASVASTAALPPAHVKASLLAEFRRQHLVAPIRRPVFRWAAITAVAAAVLLAIFLANFLPRGRRPERGVQRATAPVSVAQVPTIVPPLVKKTAVAPVKARPARARRAAPKPVEEAPEVATDFIEIPYAEALRPEERTDVFRIQVPRASMAAFGLPVTGGRLDSRITADVLTGEDGVVRAVRFVH